MGTLDNCSECGRLFVKSGSINICRSCFDKEEALFQCVSSFLKKRANRTATTYEVVNETGVSESLIHQFIRQGRLVLTNFPNISYPCMQCNAQIREGKLCNSCSQEIRHQLEKHNREMLRSNEEPTRPTYRSNEGKKE
jgi:flagellar operon protein (TIGR03826 family)